MEEANNKKDGKQTNHDRTDDPCWRATPRDKLSQKTNDGRDDQPYNKLYEGNSHIFPSIEIREIQSLPLTRLFKQRRLNRYVIIVIGPYTMQSKKLLFLYLPPAPMPFARSQQRVLRLLREDRLAAFQFRRPGIEIDNAQINADQRLNGGSSAIGNIWRAVAASLQHH